VEKEKDQYLPVQGRKKRGGKMCSLPAAEPGSSEGKKIGIACLGRGGEGEKLSLFFSEQVTLRGKEKAPLRRFCPGAREEEKRRKGPPVSLDEQRQNRKNTGRGKKGGGVPHAALCLARGEEERKETASSGYTPNRFGAERGKASGGGGWPDDAIDRRKKKGEKGSSCAPSLFACSEPHGGGSGGNADMTLRPKKEEG